MPDRDVQFGRDGLAGAAHLPLHGQPAVVADGARGCDFGAESRSKVLHEGEILGFLDAAAHSDNQRRGAQVDGLGGPAERLTRLGANRALSICGSNEVISAVPAWTASARNAPACTEIKQAPSPDVAIRAREAALHQLAREHGAVSRWRPRR